MCGRGEWEAREDLVSGDEYRFNEQGAGVYVPGQGLQETPEPFRSLLVRVARQGRDVKI